MQKNTYWMKCGIIGSSIYIFLLVLTFSCSAMIGSTACWVFLYKFSPVYFVSGLLDYFSTLFGYSWTFSESYSWIISIPVFFVIGSIVGLLFYYIKFKKPLQFIALLIVLVIIPLLSINLVSESKPSIVYVYPSKVKIGDEITLKVKNFYHENFSFVKILKYVEGEHGNGWLSGDLWVGKIPDSDTIKFTLKNKVCLDSTCTSQFDLVPNGKYRIKLLGSLKNSSEVSAEVEQDFAISQ